MPRLPTSPIKQAKILHPYLPLLLRPCRDLESARNELRWLAEYQRTLTATVAAQSTSEKRKRLPPPPTLRDLCLERSVGRPLQYILGTQPFGDLEILCRKGVLIPRPETEAYTSRLAKFLNETLETSRGRGILPRPHLKILDLGTGTGCIALLLYSRLHERFKVTIEAVDISERAIKLAKRNLDWNIATGVLPAFTREDIHFRKKDMNGDAFVNSQDWKHVVISNPPYISPQKLRSETERSVRIFEPRGALVAHHPEDDSLTRYEDVMYRLINQKKVGLSLLEFVDEDRARLYMQKVIELLRPDTSKPETLPESFRTLLLEAWRDSGESTGRSKAFGRIDESLSSIRLAAIDEEDGAMRAVVAFNGVMANSLLNPQSFSNWCRWFFRGGSPSAKNIRERNARKAKMLAVKMTEIKEKREEEERQRESETRAAAEVIGSQPKGGLALGDLPSATGDPELASQTTEGLVEALNGVAELRRAAKHQQALHRELLAEQTKVQDLRRVVQRHELLQRELLQQQTAIWDSLSEMASHINRQRPGSERDSRRATSAAIETSDGSGELVVTKPPNETGIVLDVFTEAGASSGSDAAEGIQASTEDPYP